MERRTAILVTTVLASSLAFVDSSVINVGLQAIGHSVRADASDLAWVVDAYLLPLSALLLLGGALGDRLGRRAGLIAGTTIFGLASLACALVPNVGTLLAARALQGLGAAVVLPNSLALLSDTFQGDARGRAIGIWSAAGASTAALGPLLGGALIDRFGWRAIFLINLPLVVGAVFGAWVTAPRNKPVDQPSLDWPGAALATFGLFGLTWGIILAGGAKAGALALAACGLGLLGLVAFVGVEHGRGARAMMPTALFGSRDFIGLTALTFLLYGGLGGLFVLIPYMLIGAAGYSATAAGAALLPLPILLSLASPSAGRLAARTGFRGMLVAGPTIAALGTLLLLRLGSHPDYLTDIAPGLSIVALGLSLAVAPLTTAVLATVDNEHAGVASGFNSAVARAGGLVATALLSSVLAASGDTLISRFHVAVVLTALACALAGCCGLLLRHSGGMARNERPNVKH